MWSSQIDESINESHKFMTSNFWSNYQIQDYSIKKTIFKKSRKIFFRTLNRSIKRKKKDILTTLKSFNNWSSIKTFFY